MATKEQMTAWLSSAEAALNDLLTGKRTVEVSYHGRTVKYSPAEAGQLRAYIRELEVKLGLRSGRSKAILPRF